MHNKLSRWRFGKGPLQNISEKIRKTVRETWFVCHTDKGQHVRACLDKLKQPKQSLRVAYKNLGIFSIITRCGGPLSLGKKRGKEWSVSASERDTPKSRNNIRQTILIKQDLIQNGNVRVDPSDRLVPGKSH